MPILNLLASVCSWAGWFESGFVRYPEDRVSHEPIYVFFHQLIKRATEVTDFSLW